MNVESLRRWFPALASIAAIGVPVLFAFARPGSVPGSDALFQLYQPMMTLFGERAARFVFCSLWLAIDAALIWWLVIRKHRDIDAPPVDYLAD
jgi:hypothetical protein